MSELVIDGEGSQGVFITDWTLEGGSFVWYRYQGTQASGRDSVMKCEDLACRNNNMEMGGSDTPEYWELHTLSKH